jgi:hypothetical protein
MLQVMRDTDASDMRRDDMARAAAPYLHHARCRGEPEWFPPDTAAGYVSQAEPVDFKLNLGGGYPDIEFLVGTKLLRRPSQWEKNVG